MRVAVAFDHRGVKLREDIAEAVHVAGHDVVDLGVEKPEPPVDYPDLARKLGEAVLAGRRRPRRPSSAAPGVGASVAANKLRGIRAAICHDVYSAHQGVEHDDMNVLCLGSEVVGGRSGARSRRGLPAGRIRRR